MIVAWPTAFASRAVGDLARGAHLMNKAIAIGSRTRWPGLPDVPAIAEVLPEFVSDTGYAVVERQRPGRARREIVVCDCMGASREDPMLELTAIHGENDPAFSDFLERLESAQNEFVRGRPHVFKDLGSHTGEVTLSGGHGGAIEGLGQGCGATRLGQRDI